MSHLIGDTRLLCVTVADAYFQSYDHPTKLVSPLRINIFYFGNFQAFSLSTKIHERHGMYKRKQAR